MELLFHWCCSRNLKIFDFQWRQSQGEWARSESKRKSKVFDLILIEQGASEAGLFLSSALLSGLGAAAAATLRERERTKTRRTAPKQREWSETTQLEWQSASQLMKLIDWWWNELSWFHWMAHQRPPAGGKPTFHSMEQREWSCAMDEMAVVWWASAASAISFILKENEMGQQLFHSPIKQRKLKKFSFHLNWFGDCERYYNSK